MHLKGSANKFLKVGSPDGNNNPTPEIRNLFESDSLDSRTPASFDLYVRSSTRINPYTTKYIDDNITQAQQAENDWIILRYADIVLLYAEILAQDGNHATAHNQVNKIRNRAGVNDMAAFTTEKMALDSIYKERRLELAFENHRWFDLLRMRDSYNNPNMPMEILRQHTFHTDSLLYSSFNPLPPPDESNYINERLLLPIPQTEMDSNNEMDIPAESNLLMQKILNMKILENMISLRLLALLLAAGIGFYSCTEEKVVVPKTLEQYKAELSELVTSEKAIVENCVVGYNKGDFRDALLYPEAIANYMAVILEAEAVLAKPDLSIADIMDANYNLSWTRQNF